MPRFLEEKLKKEYGDNPHAIYGTMNKLGFMRGNKETKKGKLAEKKHKMSKKISQIKNNPPPKFETRAEKDTRMDKLNNQRKYEKF